MTYSLFVSNKAQTALMWAQKWVKKAERVLLLKSTARLRLCKCVTVTKQWDSSTVSNWIISSILMWFPSIFSQKETEQDFVGVHDNISAQQEWSSFPLSTVSQFVPVISDIYYIRGGSHPVFKQCALYCRSLCLSTVLTCCCLDRSINTSSCFSEQQWNHISEDPFL